MRNLRRIVHALVVALVPLATVGCSWLTDFRQQPSVAPWQSLDVHWSDTTTPYRGNPQGSVSIAGTAVAAYQVSYGKSLATLDSFAKIPNPVAVTQASVDRGWKYFQVNCAVCHGNAGAGDGLAIKFSVFAPSLVLQPTKDRTDGYIFGMMRNGRNNMPALNRIDEHDRWHVVNYLRGLQGALAPEIVVRTVPAGLPGMTGDVLPGPTDVAPNRPAPFAKPRVN